MFLETPIVLFPIDADFISDGIDPDIQKVRDKLRHSFSPSSARRGVWGN